MLMWQDFIKAFRNHCFAEYEYTLELQEAAEGNFDEPFVASCCQDHIVVIKLSLRLSVSLLVEKQRGFFFFLFMANA